MARALSVLAIVLAALAIAAPAGATHDILGFEEAVGSLLEFDPTLDPPPDDTRRDFVVGGAQDAFGFNVAVSAHSGPSGDDPFGGVSATMPSPKVPGDTVQV